MSMPTNLAEPGKRFLAFLIDALILGIVSGILMTVAIAPFLGKIVAEGMENQGNPEDIDAGAFMAMGGAILISYLAAFIIYILYFTIMESSNKQGTFGKRAMKIYVTDTEGLPLSFGKAFLRSIGRIVNSFTMMIGYIMILFTEHKQGLHDMIASTLVLDGNKEQTTSDEFEEF